MVYTWDASFEASPADTDEYKYGAQRIRELKQAINERLVVEHDIDTGLHRLGKSGIIYVGTTAQINALVGMLSGAISFDTTLKIFKEYNGAAWVELDVKGDDTEKLAGITPSAFALTLLDDASANDHRTTMGCDAVYAALAGLNTQAFSAADGASGKQVVNVSQFGCSKAVNGYTILPNGVYLQWGVTSASDPQTVTFPVAFPTACRSVVGTLNSSSTSTTSDQVIRISNLTATTFDFLVIGSSNVGIFWQAMGY